MRFTVTYPVTVRRRSRISAKPMSCAVGVGTTTRRTRARPTDSGTPRASGTTSWVSVWPGRSRSVAEGACSLNLDAFTPFLPAQPAVLLRARAARSRDVFLRPASYRKVKAWLAQSCAVGVGTTTRRTRARPTVTGTPRATGTTTWVSVWPARRKVGAGRPTGRPGVPAVSTGEPCPAQHPARVLPDHSGTRAALHFPDRR